VHDIVRQLKELIVPERQADNSNGGSGKKIPAVDVQLILSSYRASRLSKKYNGRL
jgi:hypothetical protein